MQTATVDIPSTVAILYLLLFLQHNAHQLLPRRDRNLLGSIKSISLRDLQHVHHVTDALPGKGHLTVGVGEIGRAQGVRAYVDEYLGHGVP